MDTRTLIDHAHEYTSTCCGREDFEYIDGMCSGCKEYADFECACGEALKFRQDLHPSSLDMR
jgi:hypothetical protein